MWKALITLLVLVTGSIRAEWHHQKCPAGCFCDEVASLVSCGGSDYDDDQDQVINKNVTILKITDVLTVSQLVQRLDLRDAGLARLEPHHLNGTILKELSLVRSGLAEITEGTFALQNQMERLDLSQNVLAVLTKGMLKGLTRLRSLDLSSNRLTRIDDGALEDLSGSLEQLNLRDNSLATLGPDAFKHLERLEFLNLDGNNLTVIADSAFQGLSQLAHLILSRNPLRELHHVDLFAARPAYVDLSSAGLERVPNLMARYVRDLRLSGNKFKLLHSGDFESVPQVRLLILDESDIEDVEEDALGRLDALEVLSMDGNRLVKVPGSLPGSSLAALHLEGNRISALRSEDFAGLGRLDQLHLGRNLIDTIESGTFHQLTSLTRLNLRGNRLTRINRDLFINLVQLRLLDLSDNPLTLYRAEAEGLRHLTAQIKVLLPNVNQMDRDPVSLTTRLLLITETTSSSPSMSITPLESRTKDRRKEDDNNGMANEAILLALTVLATLTGLTVIIIASFVATGGWMKRSRWATTSKTPHSRALWRRHHRTTATALATSTNSAGHQSDVVKLSWVSAEDFDHWSAVLHHNNADTEHERLLLAVTPQQHH